MTRCAVLVGVGKYKNFQINDLSFANEEVLRGRPLTMCVSVSAKLPAWDR
jgi:hypothetical protein